MTNPAIKRLGSRLSDSSSVVTDFTAHEKYLHDATEHSGECEAIVFAKSEQDVQNCIKFAVENNLSIVARGAGTGLSGGCVPNIGSLILSTEEINQIEIDPVRKVSVVGPGAITKQLQDEAAKQNLSYPPDPASYTESTLGGNVAEGAGGLRCKRFGVTKDYVLGLKGVTAEGEILKTGCYTDENGFNLTDIINASEGTLLVITEITLRLIDQTPPGETFLVAFDAPEDAARTVSDITGAGIIPTVMEFLDGDAAECSNKYEQTEGLDNVAAILLIESNPEGGPEQVESIKKFCQTNKCSYFKQEKDPEKAERLWKVRRNLSKAVKEMSKIRISEDVAVPNSKFPELVEFVSKMNQESKLRINSFGHAGDGNLHVNFMSEDDSESGRQLIESEIEKLLRKTIDMGGTLTGEHGIGLAKRAYLNFEFDPMTLSYMKFLKDIFDPKHVLNPGKIFQSE